MNTIIRTLTPDAQDLDDFRRLGDAAKFGVKCAATAVLICVVLCATTSCIGFLAAPHIAEDGMTLIWGEP